MSDSPRFDLGAIGSTARRSGVAGKLWARALGQLLELELAETLVSTRGFQVDSMPLAHRLEDIGANFASGYNRAIGCSSLEELGLHLDGLAPAQCGFGFEGAAMGLALTDWMTPGRHWFSAFVAGPARHHEYMAWVGLGWALARLPVSPVRSLRAYRSINKWLALDGWGFHEGYFDWRRSVRLQRRARSLAGAQGQVFDQGLGRSLWFVFGAKPQAIAGAIAAFDAPRRGDLWSGVGLACAYAGGADRAGLQALYARAEAAGHASALCQGVVFAAQARWRAGNPVPDTALACQEILGLALSDAASLARESLPSTGDDLPAYQSWRAAIRSRFERGNGRSTGLNSNPQGDA